LKRIFNTVKSNKVLFQNFTSLSFLQVSNYIFPLITLPYLVRVLGAENFGLVSFVVSFTSYFSVIVDYGFSLSATKNVSLNRNDIPKLSEIYSNVLYVRLVLYLLCVIVIICLVFTLSIFSNHTNLYLIRIAGLIGVVIFPLYFFQGIEKMHFILSINFIVRSISILFVFVFIKSKNDFDILLIIYSATEIIIGFAGLFIIVKYFSIKLIRPNIKAIANMIKENFNIFLSSLSISLISNSNAFILGLFTDNRTVGYFAGADKIRLAFQSALLPLLTTIFSRVAKLANENIIRFKQLIIKSGILTLAAGITLSLVLASFNPFLVNLILGDQFEPSVQILYILAILPFLFSISNFIGIQILIPLNKEKIYSMVMLSGLVIHTIISFVIIPIMQSTGSAIAMVFTEFFLVSVFIYYLKKYSIMFFPLKNTVAGK